MISDTLQKLRLLMPLQRQVWRRRYSGGGGGRGNPNKKLRSDEEVVFVEGEILYGIYPVRMALKSDRRKIYRLFYNPDSERIAPIVDLAREKCIRATALTPASLDTLSRRSEKARGVHQGVCLDVSRIFPRNCQEDEVASDPDQPPPLWALLCGIRDPMNLGAVLRSSYYFGVDRVVSCSELPIAGLTPVVSKASAGVMEIYQPHSVAAGIEDFIEAKAAAGWQVVSGSVGMTGDSRVQVRQPVLDRPTLLVVGSEGAGVPEGLEKLCHGSVHIPAGRKLHEDVDSLNVSVAYALLVHTLKSAAGAKEKVSQN